MACSCWFIGGLVGRVIATLFLRDVFPCGLSIQFNDKWQNAHAGAGGCVYIRGLPFGLMLGVRSIVRKSQYQWYKTNKFTLCAHAWDTGGQGLLASSTDIFFVFLEFPVWYSRRTCRGYTLWGLPRQVYCHDRVRFTSCQLKNAGCQIFYWQYLVPTP